MWRLSWAVFQFPSAYTAAMPVKKQEDKQEASGELEGEIDGASPTAHGHDRIEDTQRVRKKSEVTVAHAAYAHGAA